MVIVDNRSVAEVAQEQNLDFKMVRGWVLEYSVSASQKQKEK